MLGTLILDFDGPILDGKYRHYQCYQDILTEYGYAPMPLEPYWEMKRSRVDRYQQLAASEATALYETFLREWLERIEEKKYLALDRLQDGVLDVLKQWHNSDLKLVLATMRNRESGVLWQLETMGLAPYFDEVIVTRQAQLGAGKANVVKQRVADLSATTALWIGDTEIDAEAARQLGLKICLLSCGLRTHDYLASLEPDFLVPSLKALDLPRIGIY